MKAVNEKWIEYQEELSSQKAVEITADVVTSAIKSPRVRLVLSYIGENEKVLDLGCQFGIITNEIAKKGNDVLGVDLEKVVEIAKEKYPHLSFAVHDLSREFPWPSESFDTVVALELIEHIPRDDLFLQECSRVLRKGGKLILSAPNVAYFLSRAALLIGRCGEQREHIHYYTFERLRKKIENAGFKILDEKGVAYTIAPRKWYYIEKILPKTFKAAIVIHAIKP